MNFIDEVLATKCDYTVVEEKWIQLLLQQWDILADLSFSDLILWVPDREPGIFWAAAQIRPNTGPTAIQDDIVGEKISYDEESLVSQCFIAGEFISAEENVAEIDCAVEIAAIPVRYQGKCIAVIERHSNQRAAGSSSALEDHYRITNDCLVNMLGRGEFPYPVEEFITWKRPRVGDGSLVIDAGGKIVFQSPNAVSIYRSLGMVADIYGQRFWDATLAHNPKVEQMSRIEVMDAVAHGKPGMMSLGFRNNTVFLAILPLTKDGNSQGQLVLARDITQIKIQEQKLVTKDATIREIHHRVKNNLQTVAALLRLQARRVTNPEAATALAEAMKRVAAISVVHEILSQSHSEEVAFDEVADKLLVNLGDVSATDGQVVAKRTGTFGKLPAESANSLSLVLNELCQNAVEHGFSTHGGNLVLRATRTLNELIMEVVNDGLPLPENFSIRENSNLGLSIVQNLVADLRGNFTIETGFENQTVARVRIPFEA